MPGGPAWQLAETAGRSSRAKLSILGDSRRGLYGFGRFGRCTAWLCRPDQSTVEPR
jgi:hypothetical protein